MHGKVSAVNSLLTMQLSPLALRGSCIAHQILRGKNMMQLSIKCYMYLLLLQVSLYLYLQYVFVYVVGCEMVYYKF